MVDTHSILGEALEHHQAGRREAATALYRQALEIDPREPTALYLFGLLNFESGQIEAAIDLLRRVAEVRPDHAQARFTLANIRHWRGDMFAAIEDYRAVVKLQPAHLAARIGLAKALRDNGELEAAAIECRIALDASPQDAEALETLGGIMAGLGRIETAIQAYRTALAIQPDLATAQVGLALVLLGDGRAAEALAAADTALALAPETADGWFVRGSAMMALRRADEALEALQKAVALDPSQASAHLNLGNLYGELERGEEAITHLRQAIGLDPMLKEAHASLGSLYLLTGQKEEAERFSWLALAIDPDMIVPHQNLASLLAERGETMEAQTHRDAAYGRQNLFVETAEDALRRVLILSTAESGNVPFKYLFPKARYTRINWIIEYADEGQAARLPPYDLVFNAIGDPDLASPTRAPVDRFLKDCKARVFNDPARVRRTFRHLISELLDGLAGVVAAPTLRLAPDGQGPADLLEKIQAAGLSWPVLFRPIGSHGGKGLIRVDRPDDLAGAGLPDGSDLYATAFRDYRSSDEAWRKYRVIFVDRRAYPYHLAISDEWMVHHGTAEMLKRPDRLAEELRFLQDPRAALGASAMAAVESIGQRLDLDYCGVDFTVLPDGSVLVFEANATMLVHPEAPDSVLAPKNPYVQRVLEAFEAMVTASPPAQPEQAAAD